MYSKAGRATGEIFPALRRGDDILNPKIRFFKSSSVPNLISDDKLADLTSKKFNQNGLLRDLAEILESNHAGKDVSKSPSKKMKDLKKFEPFKIMISRDDREKVLNVKKTKSNAAYYTPKYDRIDKRSLAMVDYSKTPTKRLFDDIVPKEVRSASLNSSLSLPAIPFKPSYRVKGPIALDLQASRPDIIEDQRKKKVCLTDSMASAELPGILSSVPHLPRIKFSRNLPRRSMSIETAAINCPMYTPNHEFVKRSLGKVGAELSKIEGRKNVEKVPYYTYETVYDYEDYVTNNKSHIFPRVKAPTFDKMAPREREKSNGTPKVLTSYVNTMNSRLNGSQSHSQLPRGYDKSDMRSLFGQASVESSMMSGNRSINARG